MASASPLIRDCVAFIGAYAPFSSLWTFARDIASATCSGQDKREPWQVDQLTRKVFVHSVTAWLSVDEAEWLRRAVGAEDGQFDARGLSADGRAIYSLLTKPDADGAEAALHSLSPLMQERLDALSPMNYLEDIHAPVLVFLHDRGDKVIPVGESRRLISALTRHTGVHYTEMQFQHLDPAKGKLPFSLLVREFGRFFLAMYPLFLQTVSC